MWRQEFDNREEAGSKQILQRLRKLYPDAVMGNLPSGDYNQFWLEDTGERSKYIRIESKKLKDFLDSSMPQRGEMVGRLWSQLSQVKEGEKFVILLRGVPQNGYSWFPDRNDFPWGRYVGALNSVTHAHAVLIPVADTTETVVTAIDTLFRLHRESGGRFYPDVRPFSGIEWQRGVVSMFPQIGGKRADLLWKRYNGFDELLGAAVEDLEEVLGRATGRKFYGNLHAPWR
mgnify:FL=1